MTGPLAASAPVRWLQRWPDGPEAARRALWVAAAGCTGFYVLLYVFHQPVMAVYAMFGSLPLIMFCRLPGPPRERTRTFLAALPASWALVTAGTLLAARPWAAACGMLVVGFAVAYCAVCGPRLAGLGTAFQLFYVLPSFPPYAPDTLNLRLAGLTIGVLLTALVERLLWPEPAPVPYRVRLADATAAVADYCTASGARLTTGSSARACRAAAGLALDAGRLSRVPPTERPTSPSVRDRALYHTRATVRHVRDQLDRLFTEAPEPGRHADAAATLLRQTADALRPVAEALRSGTAPPPPADDLTKAIAAFDTTRRCTLADAPSAGLRRDAIARSAAEGARMAAEAARVALGARPSPHDPPMPGGGPFWYATTPAPVLWWRRLRVHLTPQSVHLQNALRIALALACARLLAGAFGLSHGFWVLLATLSLMRTSAADTRSALRPAFLGTFAGAGIAALALLAVGNVPGFYQAALIVVILVGFTVGPLLGQACGQAVFTLAFVLLFTQLAAPDWHLSAVRLLDVLVGGAVGALASLCAWPRGGRGELRRTIADFLAEGAGGCRAVAGVLGGRADGPADPLRTARRAMILAEASYVQYRAEISRPEPDEPPWEAYMAAGYRMFRGGELMLLVHRDEIRTRLEHEAAAELTALAEQVEADCHRTAHALRTAAPLPALPPDPYPADTSGVLRCAARRARSADPGQLLLTVDTEAWLTGAARDIAQASGASGRPGGRAP